MCVRCSGLGLLLTKRLVANNNCVNPMSRVQLVRCCCEVESCIFRPALHLVVVGRPLQRSRAGFAPGLLGVGRNSVHASVNCSVAAAAVLPSPVFHAAVVRWQFGDLPLACSAVVRGCTLAAHACHYPIGHVDAAPLSPQHEFLPCGCLDSPW